MNKLIVNSDDFGYSKGINYATIDAHREGIVTSASLMANAPGFGHAVKLAKDNPKLGVGVHLVLTFLKPLHSDVPSLVDGKGNFYRPEAYRQGFAIADKDDLYKEWDAQIQKVIDAGIQPTHINTHHRVQSFNDYHLEIYLALAQKYQLPVRRNIESPTPTDFKTTTYLEPAFETIGTLNQEEQSYYLESLYQKIKENESTELMCHVGYVDYALLTQSSMVEPRVFAAKMLTQSDFVDRIKADKDIELVTFKDL